MSFARLLVVAAVLGAAASAQAQTADEPPGLTLPMGARVRLQTVAVSGSWVKGMLVSADTATISLVPEGAPPIGANQLRLPSTSIARFEMLTGQKRQWLPGLLVGVAVGLLVGATAEVDPVACEYDLDYECSRGAAYATYGIGFAALGAGIGALVKTDRWTPVALDALAAPPPRVSGVAPRLRLLPGGGAEASVTVGF